MQDVAESSDGKAITSIMVPQIPTPKELFVSSSFDTVRDNLGFEGLGGLGFGLSFKATLPKMPSFRVSL